MFQTLIEIREGAKFILHPNAIEFFSEKIYIVTNRVEGTFFIYQ